MSVDLSAIVDANISRYTVGFVLIGTGTPLPLGSGVLVRCATIQGILTCAHVLEELPRDEEFGIVQFGVVSSRVHAPRFRGDVSVKNAVKFYSGSTTKNGPDLAFVPLSESDFAVLTAIGSVIDLDGQQAKALNPQPAAANGSIEAVAGIVGQMTDPAEAEGTKTVLTAKGLVNMGHVTSAPDVGQWDLLHFEPKAQDDFVLPTNYEGTSGGGIWRIYLNRVDEKDFRHVETRLTGIAYWQDKIGENDVHGIIGHGPKSLYGHLLGAIYERWPR